MSVSATARQRIKDELKARNISQRDLADRLSKRDQSAWSQSRIGKLLNGRVSLKLDDLGMVAEVLGIHLTEFTRDRGLEFYAELTPSEVRLLERIRQWPEMMQAVWTLLHLPTAKPEPLRLVPTPGGETGRRKRGRPKHSELRR